MERAVRAHDEIVELLRIHKRSLSYGHSVKQSYDLLKTRIEELAENDSLRDEIEALKEPV